MVKRPVGKKVFNTTKENIKFKKQYKRNVFRQLRTRAVGNNSKLPEMTFYHDPRNFYSGALSSLSFLVVFKVNGHGRKIIAIMVKTRKLK